MEPPSRWLKCPRKGTLVNDLFLPCKTPLDARFDKEVPLQYRFDLFMLFSSMAQYQCKIGMLIDLTNTDRFYDKALVEDQFRCKYVKLHCKGHGQTPTADQVGLFINCVNNFRRQYPLEKIAVHCTHGYNRTGFMIISYLVTEFDWSCELAVQAFAEARPPGIYKQDYLEEIWNRFDDAKECPAAPPLPDWCWDEDEKDDDNQPTDGAAAGGALDDEDAVVPAAKASAAAGRKRPSKDSAAASKAKAGRMGAIKISQFMSGVEGVQQVLDSEVVSRVREIVRRACGFEGGRFPGCQPVSMDANNLQLLQQKDYRVSWKADGFRYMMAVLGRGEVYAIDRDNSVFLVPNLEFPSRKDPSKHVADTVLDGELVIDTVQGAAIPRYLIYDAVQFESQPVGRCPFARRLQCIELELIGPRNAMKQRLGPQLPKEPFSVRLKGFYGLDACVKLLSQEFTESLGHETDGLIFQPAGPSDIYTGGSLATLMKWKPPELNTVDFKLQWIRRKEPGCLEEHFGDLYAGGSDVSMGRIRMTKKDATKYDGKIVECRFDSQMRTWVILKERVDKSFPNKIDTVNAVIASILNPVTKERLLEFVDNALIARERSRDRQLMPPPRPMTVR
ncbi:hypothetical protein BOX15_Mlig010591g1 [Macrostomum lignano]|uniref:Uncharacterized protein n=2 Tax=Macrostomum lignano TaxID=282301 RepID=A0A267FGD4_9PLAT|nr:hypothetical protein BOX15_Mlig010591g1 [Macrostomum lignano]